MLTGFSSGRFQKSLILSVLTLYSCTKVDPLLQYEIIKGVRIFAKNECSADESEEGIMKMAEDLFFKKRILDTKFWRLSRMVISNLNTARILEPGLFQDYLHSPVYKIDTPFPYASHRLPYVFISQPQTGP